VRVHRAVLFTLLHIVLLTLVIRNQAAARAHACTDHRSFAPAQQTTHYGASGRGSTHNLGLGMVARIAVMLLALSLMVGLHLAIRGKGKKAHSSGKEKSGAGKDVHRSTFRDEVLRTDVRNPPEGIVFVAGRTPGPVGQMYIPSGIFGNPLAARAVPMYAETHDARCDLFCVWLSVPLLVASSGIGGVALAKTSSKVHEMRNNPRAATSESWLFCF